MTRTVWLVSTFRNYDFMGLQKGRFPVSKHAAKRVLSLPNYPEMTDEMVEMAAEMVKELV